GIDALTDGGRAIMVGRIGPGKHTVDAYRLMIRRMSLIGCMFGPILDQAEVSHLVDDVLARMATGELTAVIDERFPLSRAVDVIAVPRNVAAGPRRHGPLRTDARCEGSS